MHTVLPTVSCSLAKPDVQAQLAKESFLHRLALLARGASTSGLCGIVTILKTVLGMLPYSRHDTDPIHLVVLDFRPERQASNLPHV